MKHYEKLFLAAVTVLVLLTGCPGIFTGSDLSDADITAAQQELNNAGYDGVGSITVGAWTKPEVDGTFDVGIATGQMLRGTFGGGLIDAATLSAVVFYPLTATGMTDGAYTRSTPLSCTTEVTYLPASNATQVDFIFNITSGAGISNQIEIFINPAVLTANGGATRLNLDGDTVQGETQDDDYIGYFTVDSGSTIVAAGNVRNTRPTASRPIALGFTGAVGQTQFVFNVQNSLGTVGTTKAALDALYGIEKFNLTTAAWETVTTTTALNTSTGDYTLTFPATLAGESYREIIINPSAFIETVTIDGYAAKGSYDQAVTWINMGTTTIAGTMAKYNDTAAYAFNTSSDAAGHNGILEITVTGIGVIGIDPATVTPDNLRLYDTAEAVYIPWISAEVQKSETLATQANDQIILTLNPAYLFAGNFELHIGPEMFDLGDFTGTVDNLRLGDWTNTGTITYGFRIENIGGV